MEEGEALGRAVEVEVPSCCLRGGPKKTEGNDLKGFGSTRSERLRQLKNS